MSFEYNKKITEPKCVFINIVVIVLISFFGVHFGVEKSIIYLFGSAFILASPLLINLVIPFVLHLHKSYYDKSLFDKNEQRLAHLIFKIPLKKVRRFMLFVYRDGKFTLNSTFLEKDIGVIERHLGIKSVERLPIGGHVAAPAQGSVLLHKAKSVHKYLDD